MLKSHMQGGVGIELWTMTEDILFDNIYVGHSLEDAHTLAQETYAIKKGVEATLSKSEEPEDEEEEKVSFQENPAAFIRQKALTFIEAAKADPVAALKAQPETAAALIGALLTFFGMIGALFGLIGGAQKPITKVRRRRRCTCHR
jgi:hypothetical protein